jgi:mono/diheme cytochrome c family protein
MRGDVTKLWRGISASALTASVLMFAGGCDRGTDSSTALQAPLGSDRPLSVESVMRGARLYQEHCALCHGPEAQGHPDWENPQVAAAPPLNGAGNEWKRKKSDLIAIIKDGAKRNNEPVMPALGGRLSDQEIEDIVAWFQALWPMDVYDRWLKVNAGAAVPVPATEKKPDKNKKG